MVFEVALLAALFSFSFLVFLPFFLLRSVRQIADHFAEKAVGGTLNLVAEQADRIQLIQKGRSAAAARLEILPGWIRKPASSRLLEVLTDRIWMLVTSKIRIPLLIASWFYFLGLLVLMAGLVSVLSYSAGISALLLVATLYAPVAAQFLGSRYLIGRICSDSPASFK